MAVDPFTQLFEAMTAVYAAFTVLKRDSKLDPQQKLELAEDQFRRLVHDALVNKTGTGRVAFGLASIYTKSLTSSVAVQELHECYLKQCNRQYSGGVVNNGCVFVVYGVVGCGKSSATVALLAMKHGKAPKKAIWFGGETASLSGDEYFNNVLDRRIAGGRIKLSMAEVGIFSPHGFAVFLLEQMKPRDTDLKDMRRAGVTDDISGLKDFLKDGKFERTYGGTPVIVLEDVNIALSPRDSSKNEIEQVILWKREMGKAGDFFETLITQGHEMGVIVFVTTKSLTLANFFSIFNGQQKSCTFKPITTHDYTCQFFNWDREERIKFLTLQNNIKKPTERIDATRIEAIVDDSLSPPVSNIRQMCANFDDDCASEFSVPGASFDVSSWWPWPQCGTWFCS